MHGQQDIKKKQNPVSITLHPTTPFRPWEQKRHIYQTRALICALSGCDLSALNIRRFNAGERTPATDLKKGWVDPNGGLNEVAKQLSWHETCNATETCARD